MCLPTHLQTYLSFFNLDLTFTFTSFLLLTNQSIHIHNKSTICNYFMKLINWFKKRKNN